MKSPITRHQKYPTIFDDYSKHEIVFKVGNKVHKRHYTCAAKKLTNDLIAIIIFSKYLNVQYRSLKTRALTPRLEKENELSLWGKTTFRGVDIEIISSERLCRVKRLI